MAFRSQLLSQSGLSDDLTGQFERDWSAANDSYNAAVNAGNPTGFSDSLYLDPVRRKWSIISTSPQLVQNKDQFDKFNKEFNAANDLFQKRVVSDGNVADAANADGSLIPVLKKWSVESVLPAGQSSDAQKIAAAKWPQQDIDEFRQLQEAKRQFQLAAYTRDIPQEDKDALKSEADKYDKAAEAIKEKNRNLGQTSMADGDIPTAETPDAVAALPFGSKYWSHGHLFQSFSPTRGRGTITVGDKTISSPSPDVTQSSDRWSLFSTPEAKQAMQDFSNIAPQPGQTPAVTTPIVPAWQFMPQESVTRTTPTPPKGIRVRNKKTGQLGTKLSDGTIIPDVIQ